MAETKRKFNRGDFLKKDNKKGSFMIYEGNNLSETTYKRMTLVCYYEPDKYVMGAMGYEQQPHLEVGNRLHPCSDTIDTEEEDYWIKICDEREKETAKRILKEHGFYWNEETLELVDSTTGEVVRKIMIPDDKYYGQLIKPMNNKLKDLMKKYCLSKNKTISYAQQYGDYYD